MPLDVSKIRIDFPILKRKIGGKRLVYLDSAATSQKPAKNCPREVWRTTRIPSRNSGDG